MELRVIVHPPSAGDWNMAVDEALLESAAAGVATLRFYQWSEPTLSLGYFQTFAGREQHPPSVQAPVVRRSTGGGAIVHDRELTYSLTLPTGTSRSATETRHAYDTMHDTAVAFLHRIGVPAVKYSPLLQISTADEPFLCFQRRAEGDVVAGEHKLLGSAQRRARGGLLQHGSLLLATSTAAPELVGLDAWLGDQLDLSELIAWWTQAAGTKLARTPRGDDLTLAERQRAQLLQVSKFGHPRWTQRR